MKTLDDIVAEGLRMKEGSGDDNSNAAFLDKIVAEGIAEKGEGQETTISSNMLSSIVEEGIAAKEKGASDIKVGTEPSPTGNKNLLSLVQKDLSLNKTSMEEDKSEWHKPLTDLPKIMGMKSPSDISDSDLITQVIDNSLIGYIYAKAKGVDKEQISKGEVPQDVMNNMRLLYGGFYGMYESMSGLTSPFNIMLAGGSAGIGVGAKIASKVFKGAAPTIAGIQKLLQSGMSGTFTIMMGKEIPEQYKQLQMAIEATDGDSTAWGDVGRMTAHLVTTGAFTAIAAKHTVKSSISGVKQLRNPSGTPTRESVLEAIDTEKTKIEAKLEPGEIVSKKGVKTTPSPEAEVTAFNKKVAAFKTELDADVVNITTEFKKAAPPTDVVGRRVTTLSSREIETRLTRPKPKYPELYEKELQRRYVRDYKTELAEQTYNKKVHNLAKEYTDILFEDKISSHAEPYQPLPREFAYDAKHNIRFNAKTNVFDVVKARMDKRVAFEYVKKYKPLAKNLNMSEITGKELLDKVTNDNTKRMTLEQMQLINKRLRKGFSGMTLQELAHLANTGELPPVRFNEYALPEGAWRSFVINKLTSPLTIMDNMGGSMHHVKNQILKSYEFIDKTAKPMMRRTEKMLNDFLGKDVSKWKEFMTNVKAAEKSQEWPVDKNGKPRYGYDLYHGRGKTNAFDVKSPDFVGLEQGLFSPMLRHAARAEIEVYNPVTRKRAKIQDVAKKYYFPHRFSGDMAKILNARKPDMVQRLIAQGMTEHTANKTADIIINTKKGHKFGNIEYSRVADVEGWLGDPGSKTFTSRDVISGLNQYAYGTIKRGAERIFLEGKGGVEPNTYRLIEGLQDRNARNYMRELMKGIRDEGSNLADESITSVLRNLQTVRKMPLAVMQNSFQWSIGALPRAARFGFRNSIADATKSARATVREMKHGNAEALGIDIIQSIHDMLSITDKGLTGKAATKMLNMTGFSKTELFNRIFAHKLGIQYTKRLLDFTSGVDNSGWVATHKNMKQVLGELRDLGISESLIKVSKSGKKVELSQYAKEFDTAGYRFSRQTQFRAGPLEMPAWTQSPWGKVIAQFRSFSFNQARMSKKYIINPFMQNPTMANAKPILFWLASSGILGGGVNFARTSILNAIMGKKPLKPEDTVIKMIDGIASTSPCALYYSVFNGAIYGQTAGSVMGPTVSDLNIVNKMAQGTFPLSDIIPTPGNQILRELLKKEKAKIGELKIR